MEQEDRLSNEIQLMRTYIDGMLDICVKEGDKEKLRRVVDLLQGPKINTNIETTNIPRRSSPKQSNGLATTVTNFMRENNNLGWTLDELYGSMREVGVIGQNITIDQLDKRVLRKNVTVYVLLPNDKWKLRKHRTPLQAVS